MLIFATGNERKVKEATSVLGPLGIKFETRKVNCSEIQSYEPAEITKAKAISAYDIIKQPVVVSDTSWSIPALGGFPGGYMKDIASWWSAEDWLAIMKRHEDKRIICQEHLVFYDGEAIKHFESHYEGYFTDNIRGLVDESESFGSVVILYGGKTMAEQLELGEIASAGEDLTHWRKFGEWYGGYYDQ